MLQTETALKTVYEIEDQIKPNLSNGSVKQTGKAAADVVEFDMLELADLKLVGMKED